MGTNLRLMCVAAHPDDEDSETLAYYNRGYGVRTSILLGNWGEGGQNEIGPELYEELGVIRSHETLQAAELLGTQVYCLNQKDFGYSKTLEETFQMWDREEALERMVRVLRTERPHVVITNHRIGRGHGNHQAMAYLIEQAIPLAASAEAYIGMASEGLEAWKVDRLYQRRRHHEGDPEEEYDVHLPVGQMDQTRGFSYQGIASEALLRHRSQGVKGIWKFVNDRRKSQPVNYFYLIAGDPPLGPFADLFEGMEDAWWTREGGSPFQYSGIVNATPTLEDRRRKGLRTAYEVLFPDFDRVEDSLTRALEAVRALPAEVDSLSDWRQPSPEAVIAGQAGWTPQEERRYQVEVIDRMRELGREQRKLEQTLGEIWGMKIAFDSPPERVFPGDRFELAVRIANQGVATVEVESFQLIPPSEWTAVPLSYEIGAMDPLGTATAVYEVRVATGERPTLPAVEELYRSATPWQPNIRVAIRLRKADLSLSMEEETRIEIAPAWEIGIEPKRRIVALPSEKPVPYWVETRRLQGDMEEVVLTTGGPDGATQESTLPATASRSASTRIDWTPPADATPGTVLRTAQLTSSKGVYTATGEMVLANLRVPEGLTVGVVRSYDDTLPTALAMLGVDYDLLEEEEVRAGDLSGFDTILLDIRAYLEREDLRDSNHRFLDYAQNGGHLVVFYHKTYEWNDQAPSYAPYPLELSRDRVTDEKAEVTLLVPEHPLFNLPNTIGPEDWRGWVHERGLYFPGNHDDRYTELVAMADPGEGALKTGILWASVGEGTYVYTSLVFYRQLRAVVPGAYRIFANLISYPQNWGRNGIRK
jgi:LmbE family N-acetylglucosaminyl deacetylase